MRKNLIFFSFIIFLALLLVIVWQTKLLPRTTKELTGVTPVKRGNLRESFSASGKIKSAKEVQLKFQTSGLLSWVGVKEGDFVNAWQAIAQLDTRELKKNLEKALRDYSKERNDFEEEYRITYRGQTPTTALTETIKRILEKNQWDLEKAVLDVELKDIALKYATLITPISGIVSQIDTPVAGMNITPATAVFTVSDPNEVIFSVNVDEVDIDRVRPQQGVKITLDAYEGKEFAGKVNKISFTSITTSGGGTAFPVEISLPENSDLKFKLGMNGDGEFIIEEKENILIIPKKAVLERGEKKFVWVIRTGKTHKQEVNLGLQTEEETEVIEGLKEGEKIVKTNIGKIKEGEKVR